MAVNKYRGEVSLPDFGKGAFLAFDLEDFSEIEDEFGRQFFEEFEKACLDFSLPDLVKILAIGLRQRGPDGGVQRIGPEFGFREKFQAGYDFKKVTQPIMDAISMSWLGKTHAELVKEAIEARRKQDADNLQRAKEAAEEAGIPFDAALLEGLSKLLIDMASAGMTNPPSGD